MRRFAAVAALSLVVPACAPPAVEPPRPISVQRIPPAFRGPPIELERKALSGEERYEEVHFGSRDFEDEEIFEFRLKPLRGKAAYTTIGDRRVPVRLTRATSSALSARPSGLPWERLSAAPSALP